MDGSCIAIRNPIWVQKTLTALIRMFKSLGMQTNLGKTKEIVLTPSLIWGKLGLAEYKRIVTGLGGHVLG